MSWFDGMIRRGYARNQSEDMFSSPKRDEYSATSSSSGGNATVIARGVKVEGDFTSQGDVQIEGEVHGHVSTSGLLTVGSEAKLKADVSAEEAVIAGLVEGNVTVKKRLELKSTAKILGDITCETVAVEEGATMHGKVGVGASPKSVPATDSKDNRDGKKALAAA